MKSRLVIVLVIGLMTISRVSLAQVTSFDHDKYWFYRWRLTHQFLKEGQTDYSCSDPHELISGYSIPAGDLQGYDLSNVFAKDVFAGKCLPHWGDGTSNIGWYVSVLATEWRLLKNNGQSTTAVEEELFYAMKAYERVDKNVGILFSPNEAKNCAAPDGFFGRDDVTIEFIKQNFPGVTKYRSEYVDMNYDKDGAYSPMVNRLSPSEAHPYNSIDQVSDLMMGFALVVKCLDPSTNYKGYYFKDQAKIYTRLMANYLKSHNYKIIEPITGQVVKYGAVESQMYAFPVGRAADKIVNESWGSNNSSGEFDFDPNFSATALSSDIWQAFQLTAGDLVTDWEGNNKAEYSLGFRHELAAIGHSWEFGAIPRKCYRLPVAFVPFPPWVYYADFWRYDLNVDPTGLTLLFGPTGPLGPNGALGANGPLGPNGPFGPNGPLSIVGSTGNVADNFVLSFIQKNSCIPVRLPALVYNTTDFTLGRQGAKYNTELYSLLHQYLNGGNNNISDGTYQKAISTAPCIGPYNFHGSPVYEGVEGWRSSVRWQKRKSAFSGGGDEGQLFNGLDYMLLYNLWALRFPSETKVKFPGDSKVTYNDELNPVYNFFSTVPASGRYYGFESMKVTGTVGTPTSATFLSPRTVITAGSIIKTGVSFSAPANGVSLQCDSRDSGLSFSRVAALDPGSENLNKPYSQYVAEQIKPQIQKVTTELAKHKYVPIQEYAKKGPTTLKESSDNEDSPVKLYPNPSSGAFTLSSDKPIVEVRLQTLLGEPLVVQKVDNGSTTVVIEAFSLPTETYICVIQTTDGVVVKKWIKR